MKFHVISLYLLLFSFSVISQEISIELFQQGFNRPLSLENVGDDRLFIVEQGGLIKIVQADGSINPDPFLDLSNKVSSGSERGLLGLAFHPDYYNNGHFYVNYTKQNGDTQVSRFTAADPDTANPNSELPIIDYAQPASNHNGGAMTFGPDGFLYISSGDGGGSGDPNNNAQNLNLLLGKLLRIDVDNISGSNNYAIPSDNPFVGVPDTRPEIWAYGLRNPWRFSFDEIENHLWIADVGQTQIEEINRVSIDEGGLNYGWRCYEGSEPYNTSGCPSPSEIMFPLAEYNHTGGNCSITGGYVYRGSQYTDIAGLYFFADYCSGMIGTVDAEGNKLDHGNYSGMWASFGEDADKELYILDISGGKIYKIHGGEVASTDDHNLSRSFTMVPNPASNAVSVLWDGGKITEIQIFDQRGRLVYQEGNLYTDKKVVSVSDLESGLYFVRVSANNWQSTKKLILQ